MNGESVLLVAETTVGPHATPASTGAVWNAHVRAYPFFGSVPCWRHAPHSRILLEDQLSPLLAYCRTTIQRPVCPPASVPVILNRCQEVVIEICVGPARYAPYALFTMAMDTCFVPDATFAHR